MTAPRPTYWPRPVRGLLGDDVSTAPDCSDEALGYGHDGICQCYAVDAMSWAPVPSMHCRHTACPHFGDIYGETG